MKHIYSSIGCMLLFAAFMTSGWSSSAWAADKPSIYTAKRSNVAVGGYDTVSFFSGQPVKGDSQFSYTYKGTQWHFTNQGNLDMFKENPEVFAPQYGGYCAWAVATNKTAKGDPRQWHIKDGKLYLNYNARIKKKWLKDTDGFIYDANKNWPNVLKD